MATDLIRYDLLVQDAMRGVMRRVLADVAASGYLPGDHNFTISFRTGAPGVHISKRLAEQWPQELTIILQHQYSNLTVDEHGFGVGLSFRSIFEQIYIPFAAVTGFFDPSVEFGLKFQIADEREAEPPATARLARSGPTLVTADAEAHPASSATPAPSAKPASAKAKPADPSEKSGPDAPQGDSAKIVSIDTFRKKH